MKIFYLLFAFVLLPSLCASAQYRAGETIYHPDKQFSHWEIAAAWEGSSSEISLTNGSTSSDGLHGISSRVLYYPFRAVAVGVEGTYFHEQSVRPLIQSYRASRLGVVGKFHLSVDTNPRIYLVAGAGQTSHRLKYISLFEGLDTTKDIFYGMFGIGTEITLYRSVFMLLEGRALYNKHTQLSRFYALTKRWESSARIGLGARF